MERKEKSVGLIIVERERGRGGGIKIKRGREGGKGRRGGNKGTDGRGKARGRKGRITKESWRSYAQTCSRCF